MAQGSITKHVAGDGTVRYRARADGGLDAGTGKRRQLMKTFKTMSEARAWLRDAQVKADKGEWAGSGTATLGEWITTWLAGPGMRGRRPTTLHTYELVLTSHVLPTLGAIRLSRLTPVRLEAWVAGLETTLAPASVALVFAALHTCLGDAERLGVVAVSPLHRVKTPSRSATERPHWTAAETGRFLAATQTDDDRALWLTMLLAGLRIGEALALTWEDCDLAHGYLTVRRTLTAARDGRPTMGTTTKSGKARRLPMTPVLAGALREQHAYVLALQMAHRDIWSDQGLIFPGACGEQRSATGVRVRLAALCTWAGVPALTPHGLRHTCASLLGERASAAEVRDLLGHSSLTVTNAYLHSDDARTSDALAALATHLAGA